MLSPTHLKRAVATVYIANVFTWYEFSLYILFSSILASLYFPDKTPTASLIHIFLIFAIGFLSRPLGTLFFSHIGDKIGRKTALVISIILMTIPTFGIGLIPSYAMIGIAAPILLALMRLMQGFATGGEFAGTMCYFYEITPIQYRGFTGSLTFSSSQMGNVLSTLEFLLLQKHVSFEVLSTWGWRISFITGTCLGLLGWFLRRTLHETPLFVTMKTEGKTSKKPVIEAFTNYKLPMVKAFGLTALTVAGWYLIFVFSPLYLSKVLGMDHNDQLVINLLLLLFSSLIMPLFGYMADRDWKRPLFFISAIGPLLLALPLYIAANHFSFFLFIVLEFLMILLLTAQFALLPTILSEMFPLRVRYTCVGISYNFCNMLFGGATPVVAFTLTTKTGYLLAPAFILILAAIISLWSYTRIKEENIHSP